MDNRPAEGFDNPVIYRPDPDVANRLIELIYQRRADLHVRLVVTDMRTGNVQTIFVHWSSGDLDTLSRRLQEALTTDPGIDYYEPYFWLFWRGWDGCLNPEVLDGLPAVTPDLLDKVGRGVPLRDSDLRRLQSALEWAFANQAGEWGTTDSWQDGTISPGHLSLRKKLGEFIQRRMTELHGSHYENAPVNP